MVQLGEGVEDARRRARLSEIVGFPRRGNARETTIPPSGAGGKGRCGPPVLGRLALSGPAVFDQFGLRLSAFPAPEESAPLMLRVQGVDEDGGAGDGEAGVEPAPARAARSRSCPRGRLQLATGGARKNLRYPCATIRVARSVQTRDLDRQRAWHRAINHHPRYRFSLALYAAHNFDIAAL
jgi:hypothetical protein